MKKLMRKSLLLMSLFGSLSSYATYTEDLNSMRESVLPKYEAHEMGLKINVAAFCPEIKNAEICKIRDRGISIDITSSHKMFERGGKLIGNYYQDKMYIVSNLKVVGIDTGKKVEKESTDKIYMYGASSNSPISFHKGKYAFTILPGHGESSTLSSIIVEASHEVIYATLQSFTNVYDQAFKLAKKTALSFQGGISKYDRSHIDRYVQALEDSISLLNDENNYALVDWRVTEAARRVVTFGMVISEVLERYDDVPHLENQISSIRALTNELRASYGWDKGIAGNVSKASGALLELVEFELTEIAKVKISAGFSNLGVYSGLIAEVQSLMSKVNASESGDMAMQRELFDLMDKWNSEEWQDELRSLVEAKADFKSLVNKKLSILLMAVESINDFSRMNFKVPTEVKLGKE
ncbi:hypothetical protein HBN50_03605 [Halobacteriovorax sp. GB3]|uniref:hypothetical protein n=1 Tax=Halobacteriovorax sp. GB3 TaxID=2719615 RepID=UPI002360B6DA|nr:hypothetical protein [Halobacteriovorax sp. GB3]MDD0852164.1 hypothetical protein [Halobacteriovorax sp. GB3]